MMPPNPEFLDRLWKPALESLQVAVWGTLLGVVIAVPVCFFAARNLSPSPVVFHATRQILNCMRGINEIILALIFVAAIGLGPFAGVLALAHPWRRHARKVLCRVDRRHRRRPAGSLPLSRGRPVQDLLLRRPAAGLPTWLGTVFYRLETNVRQSTVLGMVGAGGIGFELVGSMKLFQYQDTATCILVIVSMVMRPTTSPPSCAHGSATRMSAPSTHHEP
jgi:phosphonate transport system permease protein